MPWLKWMPWRFVIRRLARAHGFLDPVALLARLQRFAQPAEVAEPVELLRGGAVQFHGRDGGRAEIRRRSRGIHERRRPQH